MVISNHDDVFGRTHDVTVDVRETRLFVLSINVWASTCARSKAVSWTAIWSPSKSALKPLQTSGCRRRCLRRVSVRTLEIPIRCNVRGSLSIHRVIRDEPVRGYPKPLRLCGSSIFFADLESYRHGPSSFKRRMMKRVDTVQRDLLRKRAWCSFKRGPTPDDRAGE